MVRSLWLALLISLQWLPTEVKAAPMLQSSIFVGAFNRVAPSFYVGSAYDGAFSESILEPQLSNMVSGNRTISGLDQAGLFQISDVGYEASNVVSFDGTLKAYAKLEVQNPFYNELNPPFVEGVTDDPGSFLGRPIVNPDGAPEQISVRSRVSIFDTFSFQGDPAISEIIPVIEFTGSTVSYNSVPGSLVATRTFVVQSRLETFFVDGEERTVLNGSSFIGEQDILRGDPANFQREFNEVTFGLPIAVEDFEFTVQFSVEAMIDIGLRAFDGATFLNDDPNTIIGGEVDLNNTFSIQEFLAFDNDGNLVDLRSVTGSSGQEFNTRRVLQVSSAAESYLFYLSFIYLCFVRRSFRWFR